MFSVPSVEPLKYRSVGKGSAPESGTKFAWNTPTPDDVPGLPLPDVGSVGRMLSDEDPEQPASRRPRTRTAGAMRWLMAEAPAK
jgi:hypothetical protein